MREFCNLMKKSASSDARTIFQHSKQRGLIWPCITFFCCYCKFCVCVCAVIQTVRLGLSQYMCDEGLNFRSSAKLLLFLLK